MFKKRKRQSKNCFFCYKLKVSLIIFILTTRFDLIKNVKNNKNPSFFLLIKSRATIRFRMQKKEKKLLTFVEPFDIFKEQLAKKHLLIKINLISC